MKMSEFRHFLILTPFVTSLTPNFTQNGPNWPKIGLKDNKTRPNDGFDLKIGMGMFFEARKPMNVSEFRIF